MKRFFVFFLIAILLLALCACSKSTTIATSTEEFDNIIGTYIDLSLYNKCDPLSAGGSTYEQPADTLLNSTSMLDYTISFKTGGTVDLASLTDSLESNGWNLTESSNPVSALFETPYSNTKGQLIYVKDYSTFQLFSESTSAISIRAYESQTKEDGTDHLVKVDNVPFFTLQNEITNNSTLQDVIDTLGAPWRVSFAPQYEQTPTPTVELLYGKYDSGSFMGSLSIVFNAENGELISILYAYNN